MGNLHMRLKISILVFIFSLLVLSSAVRATNHSHPSTPSLVNVPDNTWVQVDQGSVTAPANIMSYSGGWYDPQNHQFCIFGGGHWDYSGNEVWCLDIALLTWREMYAPDVVTTQTGDQGAYNNYDNTNYPGAVFNPAGEPIANANPASRHSYDQMEYVEGLGSVVWGGYLWGDGSATLWCDICADTWVFNFTTANWQYLYDGTNPSPITAAAGIGASAYSSADNLMYSLVTGATWTFNPSNNRWTELTTTGEVSYGVEMTMEYDSKRNRLYTFGGTYPNDPSLFQFDIATSTWSRLTPTGTGPDISAVFGAGVAYDQANDVLLIYQAGNIWAYDPNNNSWAQYSPAVRPVDDGYGVFGRFRYDPINNGAWYHGWQDGQHTTWFYRFSNSGTPPTAGANIAVVTVVNQAASNQNNLAVTLGHVFKAGDIPASATVGARLSDNTPIELQVDKKATHADGSLRHAVITVKLPSLDNGGTQTIKLSQTNTSLAGTAITITDLLATNFDATVTLSINGVNYSASARELLQNTTPVDWLTGPLASEWLVNGPVTTTAGATHPHLSARFAIRVFENINRVRVSVTLENSNVLVANPGLFVYDVSVNIQGQGEMFSQTAVPHYRQSRWRRVFWWGSDPQVHIIHDKNYFESTRAIPTYDSNVSVPDFRLNEWASLFNQNSDLMEFGLIEPYMPGGGDRARSDIAPLPGWTATWLLSQDPRAKASMLGTDEQAGTYNVHFRDENTGYPIRATDHTNWQAYVSDDSGGYYPPGLSNGFPGYAVAEPSHEPDIAYVPYLVTGDYFYLEEMQFWASWNIMYGSNRGGANGYVVWDQVRGQAWSLRSIAHAAYATPDNHLLKSYYLTILDNNRQLMENKWLNTQASEFRWPAIGVNPLGYITNEDWLGYSNIMSTWMDDFLTWSVGHIHALGFSEWTAFRDYKVRFPVGRTIDSASCWVLAPSYWPDILDTHPGGANTGNPVTSWQAWQETIVYSSNIGSLVNAYGVDINLSGSEQAFLAAGCASSEMYGYLTGVNQGEVIGYSLPDSYIANLQVALAVSVEANYPNAQTAFDLVQSATNLPDYSGLGRPAWAIVPATMGSNAAPPVPSPAAPTIVFSASPTVVDMNGTSTLSWSVSNADTCTGSDAWAGTQPVTGSLDLTQLTVDVTYVLTCAGSGGTASRSITISVNADDTGDDSGGSGNGGGNGSSGGFDNSNSSGAMDIMFLFCFLYLLCYGKSTSTLKKT